MRVHTLSIGTPQELTRGDRTVRTSVNRTPTLDAVMLTPLGFEGDQPADLRFHGGPDKAICCYPLEHYAFWREKVGPDFEIPAFGENLTTEGMLEAEVCLGDVFRIGDATVQISQPRQPCGTLVMKHDCKLLPKWVNERHFTGFYMRVLKPGRVRAGDAIEPISRGYTDLTVATMNAVMLDKHAPVDVLNRLVSLPELAEAWREDFMARLSA